jgi:phosphoglycolate phosphatase-like HAD superfamily hydrolase
MASFAHSRLRGMPEPEVLEQLISERAGTSLSEYIDWFVHYANSAVPNRRDSIQMREDFAAHWTKVSDQWHTDEYLTKGAIETVSLALDNHAEVYILTGGDVHHKRSIIRRSALADLIPEQNIIGDGDARMGDPATKKHALKLIVEMYQQYDQSNRSISVVMVGDGTADMIASRSAGALAVGFRQEAHADVVIHINELSQTIFREILWPESRIYC